LLPFLIAGIATGSVYGLAGVGLVLTYKTSGIFNFAHGTIATVTAFIFYSFYVQAGLPWWLGAILSVVIAGPILGLGLERLARSAAGTPLATRVVATVGLLLFLQSGLILIYGSGYHLVPGFLGSGTFQLGSTVVTWAQVIVFLVSIAATSALYLYFRFTRGGVVMRAVVDDPALLDLAGTNPIAVRRRAWIIGASFAAISGILLVQLFGEVDPTTFTLLVLQAFAAAAIGRFTKLPATYVGGIALGIGASFCTKYFTSGLLSGLAASLPFVVLMVVLLLSRRVPFSDVPPVRRSASLWRAPMWLQAGGGGVVLVLLIGVPFIVGSNLDAWTSLLCLIILFASLGLLVRTAGEVSLCQISFQAIGVVAVAHLMGSEGLPWLAAIVLAAVITLPISAFLAIPAVRQSGLYLALVSLGFGIVLQYMFYDQGYMFGSTGFGLSVPRPSLSWLNISSDRGYYYFVLAVVVVVLFGVIVLTRGRLGGLLRALGASPTGLATSGTSVIVTRVLVFCLSGALAAVSGVLGGGVFGTVTADGYQPLTSLTFFVVIMITLGGVPWYAIAAAFGLAILPIYFQNPTVSQYLALAFGLGAMLFVMVPPERRSFEGLKRGIDRITASLTASKQETIFDEIAVTNGQKPAVPLVPLEAHPGQTAVAAIGLEVSDLRVQFGGLVAVSGVSLTARPGQITGLIGPNGAGKTTLFNACSGLNQPRSGEFILGDSNITGLGVPARARRGLGRTFQQMQLFDDLSVMENIAIGREGGYAGTNPLEHIMRTRKQARIIEQMSRDALHICDLESVSDLPVGNLSTGKRRLVELARCLAGPFRVLLLDEPSSGLDERETQQFGQIVQRLVEDRKTTILLVEHDLDLVTKICDYIYVLDFGTLLFEGTPSEVLASPEVQAAYLGDDFANSSSAAEDPRKVTL
jgi:ABC-type branched-subunit amino acid transport system ATPase component/branched-subunit amino acid ABC-type transport system permease component